MPNQVYYAPGTPVTFKASGGTVTFTPQNMSHTAGRISAQWDRGAGSLPALFEWRAKTKVSSAAAIGTRLEIYLVTSDGTIIDGNLGTSDAAFADGNKRANLRTLGSIPCDSTTDTVQMSSGIVEIRSRYISVVWWNQFGQVLTNVAGDHEFILTPVPDEIQ
jgi:hypothetical protein